jgi:hypothetical protein
LWSQATLSHRLPEPARALEPADEAEDVPTTGVRISWTPVEGVAAYLITVEQEDSGLSFSATVAGDADNLMVPDGFLDSGLEYQLAIGTVAEAGNTSFVESTFTTVQTR